jgi:hypothetical protein
MNDSRDGGYPPQLGLGLGLSQSTPHHDIDTAYHPQHAMVQPEVERHPLPILPPPAPERRYPPEPDLTGVSLKESILEILRKGVVSELHPGLQFNSKEYSKLSLPGNCSKQLLLEKLETMVKEQAEINQLLKAESSIPVHDPPVQMDHVVHHIQHNQYPPQTHDIEPRQAPFGDVHPNSEAPPGPARAVSLLQRLKLSGAIS